MAKLVYSYEQLLEIQNRALLAAVAYSGNLVEGRAFDSSDFADF